MTDAGEPEGDSAVVWHYDGRSGHRREAVLTADGDRFTLVDRDGQAGEDHAFADLVRSDVPGTPSFALKRRPGWRIGFEGAIPPALARRLPGKPTYGGVIDRYGLWPMTAAFGVVAAIVVVLVLRTPALVARMVPRSVEQRLGEVMVGDFGRRGCTDPAGNAALAKLVERVDPADRTLDVHVVSVPIVNAVTLPGGRIVVFDGLIKAARSPDEVAGVIGHEVGHVRHHDVMESLLRQLGLSVVLGGMEGHVGGYTNVVLATAYSRDAEARADGYAIAMMDEAKVSPAATAQFFRRLSAGGEKAERMFSYVASHPVSADRATRFDRAVRRDGSYTPALDAADWRALRGICRGDKAEAGFNF